MQMSGKNVTWLGRLLVLGLMIAGMAWPVVSAAEEMTMNSAINKAGRQRMLSQRMVRLYCQIGLNVRKDEALQQLPKAIALFDTQLSELKQFVSGAKAKEALSAVEAQWPPFKAIVSEPYSRSGAEKLLNTNEDLLLATQRAVAELEGLSGKKEARLVNISGRQRMLSQRLGKFYMLREMGLKNAQVLGGLDQTKSEFTQAHVQLKVAPENTEEIQKLLDMAGIQMQLLEYSIKDTPVSMGEFVVLTTDKILGIMDLTTAKYEALGQPKKP